MDFEKVFVAPKACRRSNFFWEQILCLRIKKFPDRASDPAAPIS